MKHTILALIMILSLPFMGKADNNLILQNNTAHEISAAIVWFNHGQQCWESRGWFTIEPYSSITQSLHALDLGSTTMFVYAQDTHIASDKWIGNVPYRVDNNNAFDILYADQITAKTPIRKFTMVNVGKGDTRYTFNP